MSIFININDTIYVTDSNNSRIQIWTNGNSNPTQTVSYDLAVPTAVFVTITGDIYINNDYLNGRIDKWMLNRNTSIPVMYVNSTCFGLFVDVSNTLYCSIRDSHQVVKRWLNDIVNTSTIVAGTGIPGNTSDTLNSPRRIFVDTNLDLYVPDAQNHRIQLFRLGQSNAITVAGSGSINITITLNFPSAVVLDADKYLFIADGMNNRIVASGPYGFRCIIGCSNTSGSAADQLLFPLALSFDNFGNIFVIDGQNSRVQKFFLLPQSSGKSINYSVNSQIITAVLVLLTEPNSFTKIKS